MIIIFMANANGTDVHIYIRGSKWEEIEEVDKMDGAVKWDGKTYGDFRFIHDTRGLCGGSPHTYTHTHTPNLAGHLCVIIVKMTRFNFQMEISDAKFDGG